MKTRVLEDLCFSGYALYDATVRMFNVRAGGYVALLWLDFPPDCRIPVQGLVLRKSCYLVVPNCDPYSLSS